MLQKNELTENFEISNPSKAASAKANLTLWMTLNYILTVKLSSSSVEIGDHERKYQCLSPHENGDKALLLRIKNAKCFHTLKCFEGEKNGIC